MSHPRKHEDALIEKTPRALLRVIAAAAGVAALAMVGCNTIEGAGEDIEAGGDAIDDAAEDAN